MKRFFLLSVVATVLFTGCSPILVSKTNMLKFNETNPVVVTDVMADLEVSETKVTYFYIPNKAVNKAGHNNVVETAVREALIANGNADVMLFLDKQMKINKKGKIESITISGYPAKYVKFRSLDEKYILDLVKLYENVDLRIGERVAPNVCVPNFVPDIIPDNTPKAPSKGKGGLSLMKPRGKK